MNILHLILTATAALFESFWRRLFGGLSIKPKFLEIRGVQHFLNCVFLLLVFYYKFNQLISTWWILGLSIVYMTALWQIEFWTRAHGPEYDAGRDRNPTEEMISRYEQQWFCRWILTPVYNYMGWKKYLLSYDLLAMIIRYTYPCVYLFPLYGENIFLVGLAVGPVYAFSWSFYEHENTRYGSTMMAEWIVGAIVGFGLMWIEPVGLLLPYLK